MGQQDRSGLTYKRNRYYDPGTGQFTQQDPIGIAGGLNLYGYANGDPINFSDPFGLKADTLWSTEGEVLDASGAGHQVLIDGEVYDLDYGLGGTPHTVEGDALEAASSWAAGGRDLTSAWDFLVNSLPGGDFDFKQGQPVHGLWTFGNSAMHRDKVGNAAWASYGGRRGIPLAHLLLGAAVQGKLAGGEDPLDQQWIRIGYVAGTGRGR
jgi:RHS repeat-associated protein